MAAGPSRRVELIAIEFSVSAFSRCALVDELGHEGRPDRLVQRKPDADQERVRVNMPELDHAGQDDNCHRQVDEERPRLDEEQRLALVEPIGDHAAEEAQPQHGHRAHDVDEGNCDGRAGQLPGKPAPGDDVGVHRGRRADLPEPQVAEVPDLERGKGGEQALLFNGALFHEPRGSLGGLSCGVVRHFGPYSR